METAKLQKLERQAHQWVQQALPSLDKLDTIFQILLDAAEEKYQFMGPDMEIIADLSIQEKMSTLSSITTLTIDIQKVLQSWTKFQHQKKLWKYVCRNDQPSGYIVHEDKQYQKQLPQTVHCIITSRGSSGHGVKNKRTK